MVGTNPRKNRTQKSLDFFSILQSHHSRCPYEVLCCHIPTRSETPYEVETLLVEINHFMTSSSYREESQTSGFHRGRWEASCERCQSQLGDVLTRTASPYEVWAVTNPASRVHP